MTVENGSAKWTTVIAPSVGPAGLITACVLIVNNYSALTGKISGLINQLPWLLLAAAILGLGYALWLGNSRPPIYAGIGEGENAPTDLQTPAEPATDRPRQPAAIA